MYLKVVLVYAVNRYARVSAEYQRVVIVGAVVVQPYLSAVLQCVLGGYKRLDFINSVRRGGEAVCLDGIRIEVSCKVRGYRRFRFYGYSRFGRESDNRIADRSTAAVVRIEITYLKHLLFVRAEAACRFHKLYEDIVQLGIKRQEAVYFRYRCGVKILGEVFAPILVYSVYREVAVYNVFARFVYAED